MLQCTSMGADDGHGPHANKNDLPFTPRGGGGEPCGDLLPGKQNFPKGVAKTVQTEAPSSYAIAGKVIFAAAGAFAGILLALIALHMYNSGRRRYSRDHRRLLRSLANISGGDSGGAAVPESPRARGLDPAVLRALPVVVPASSGSSGGVGGAGGGDDCAVCLAEFEQGEEARALPRCGHRFHVECIDAWFRGNSTCPLCRADVEAPAPDEAEARPAEEVRIDVVAGDAAAKGGGPPAMPSGGSSLRPDPLPSDPSPDRH